MDEYWIVSEKGRALMGLMSRGVSLPPIYLHWGQALYALEDGYEVMPWIIEGLDREGYIFKDIVNEQADGILMLSQMRRR